MLNTTSIDISATVQYNYRATILQTVNQATKTREECLLAHTTK